MTDLVHREAEFLLYQTEDGRTRVEVRFDGETAWLSLGQMADLFQRDKSVISRHIKNVFGEGERDRTSVVAEFAGTAADGKTHQVEYFDLDVIISVGHRVKSHGGTEFRTWATHVGAGSSRRPATRVDRPRVPAKSPPGPRPDPSASPLAVRMILEGGPVEARSEALGARRVRVRPPKRIGVLGDEHVPIAGRVAVGGAAAARRSGPLVVR